MSNETETDLDWLARNVHQWAAGATHVAKNRHGHLWAKDPKPAEAWFTRDQWLARRAELQNKPSWDDFGESAKFMAQDSDGAWMAFDSEPAANYHVWSSMRGWCGYAREGRDRCRGEVLGDWRDTLEKRPADLSEQAVTARLKEATDNVLAAAPELMTDKYKFEPFVGVEDSQEKEMKQGNGWFERGELPPVGKVCLYVVSDRLSAEVEITAHAKFGLCFVEVGKSGENYVSKTAELHRFRPIRTERDKLVELIKTYRHTFRSDTEFADAILAAGFKRGGAA